MSKELADGILDLFDTRKKIVDSIVGIEKDYHAGRTNAQRTNATSSTNE